jgi:hypothetical protein
MTTTRILVAFVTLLIATQVSSAVESSSPSVDSLPAAAGSPPVAQVAGGSRPHLAKAPDPTRPTTLTPPDGQQNEATATDPMDADSGLRLSHRQMLNLSSALAFSAGFVAGLLLVMILTAARILGQWLGTLLTRLESLQNLTRGARGQTPMNANGGGPSTKDNG